MSDILKRGFGDPTPDKTPGGSTSGKRAASAIQDKTRRPSLASMDATVIVQGPMGNRRIPFTDFHPLIRSRISAWESCASVKGLRRSAVAALGQPAFASSIRGRADMIWPGVQNPHWNRRGIPQGSPISPLLANLYMRRFVLGWRIRHAR
jgi:hypothetical protein